MDYTTATTIAGPSAGNPDTIIAWAKGAGAKRPDDVARYITEVYRLAGIAKLRAEVVIAQAIHECSDVASGAPFASSWWVDRCNPAGIGITGDPAQDDASADFQNGTSAAKAHVTHLYLYAVGTALPAGLSAADDPRWDVAVAAGRAGIAPTIAGLTNTWGMDPNYANALLGRLIALSKVMGTTTPAPSSPPASGGTSVGTDFTLYTFPGLKKQVPIPSWIKVVIPDPLPDGPNLTNHTPSSAFTKTTWHDTGNDTTKAADEYAWLKNGRPGGEPGDYSGIFDDTTIYITSRFDEDVWHAGTPEGNHTSYGFEQAFGGGVDFNKSLQVGAALHGGLIAALGWSVDTALVKHQYWYGKWCPGQILNKGIWSQVVAMVSDAALAAAAFLNGGTVPKDAPVYAKPVPIPELEKFKGKPDSAIPYRVEGGSGDNAWIAFYVGDRVQAIKATDRMRYSTGGEVIGAKLQPNEQFDVDWIITSKAGKYADVYYTPWATRIRAADCQRVSDVKAAA